MLKTFYVQTDEVKRITDVIEIPYGDYVQVELNTPLPFQIMGGAYQLINGQAIYKPEWDTNYLQAKITKLEKDNADLTFAMMNGGLL
ncbi:hypothetical protein C672_1729 [[Clostridium] bifermentans ATCC 638]|uniref:Uncharacterized protein n=1 Tax=Paraclostridium bifermentans ATCC 638 = DSM 14991 TaxID=1233171 RepID=T4VNS8_PARBF|nr:hypothetical protein [Paraclostridium bifermentans]EQK42785.1 hypothetical protein C672_1729 [[Clostridium] bifermentans ATCC 638] [Paraclostridium bifermentans ATCC 638 = DSM 14991]RIZ58461.1 hypothetical protein CHH45_11600 [Paraclostridium bifermentans]UAG19582.1 hypothetical protein KXZ80_07695 [Paraclostridium bifermentans]